MVLLQSKHPPTCGPDIRLIHCLRTHGLPHLRWLDGRPVHLPDVHTAISALASFGIASGRKRLVPSVVWCMTSQTTPLQPSWASPKATGKIPRKHIVNKRNKGDFLREMAWFGASRYPGRAQAVVSRQRSSRCYEELPIRSRLTRAGLQSDLDQPTVGDLDHF